MIILKICQKQPFEFIALTPRRILGVMLCSYCPINDSSTYYTLLFTLLLCYKPLVILHRITKSQKVHILSHNVLLKLHNIDFTWHRSRGFQRDRVAKEEFAPSPIKFLRKIKNLFPEIWEFIHHIKWRGGRTLDFLYQDTFWTLLLL